MQVGAENLISASDDRGSFGPAELYVIPPHSSAAAGVDVDRQIALAALAGAGALTLAWTVFSAWLVVRAAQWALS
jgi:hypothetical protein